MSTYLPKISKSIMINTYSLAPKFLETYILSLKYQTYTQIGAKIMSLACFVTQFSEIYQDFKVTNCKRSLH